ncbi:MAG: response regulator transcription factor [Lachnospiraceae bacterium]|nr:response regulator transcription factor [Lachnospiraceae bacterium]
MKRILVVEDEEAIAELERDYLQLSNFEVVIEKDGTAGLQRAMAEEFNMYILDVMLPGTDGFEICRRIREVENRPILMVSAKKEDIDKIRGLGLGADDYITKPFSPSELVARVKAHLARYEQLINTTVAVNDVLTFRGLRMDKGAKRIWVDGVEKTLAFREFEVLEFFVEHPNHVYTKDEIYRAVWKDEPLSEHDLTTVRVHITRIRDKIEKDNNNPQYIETIWGAGYRMKM